VRRRERHQSGSEALEEATGHEASTTPAGQRCPELHRLRLRKGPLSLTLDRRASYRRKAKKFPQEPDGTIRTSLSREKCPTTTRELHWEHHRVNRNTPPKLSDEDAPKEKRQSRHGHLKRSMFDHHQCGSQDGASKKGSDTVAPPPSARRTRDFSQAKE
jgi:hypothetical protein